jgi:glucose/arabinose dehydrogenase
VAATIPAGANDTMTNRNHSVVTGLLAMFFLAGTSFVAAEELNTLSEAEKKAGWKLLFDGKTTKGWRNYQAKGISDGWKIVNGALTRAGKGAGDIITAKQYDSFELSLEYNISKGGNSGIMFHVDEKGKRAWHSGPEIQIQDNVDGHDPQKSGWLYQLYSSKDDSTKPAGQWNQFRMTITPKQCAIYMNGLRYARFVKGSEDWKKRVAKSKFSKYATFGASTTGHICLQDHGNLVAYRNIKIRNLKEGTNLDPVDGTLAYKPALAFPNLQWAGWDPINEAGKPQPLRPIILTHAGDGSNRVFVATQRGVIHVFDNDQKATKTEVYADLSKKVSYSDRQNEEGFLGFAFHPNYEKTGEFFAYYTTRKSPHTSVISRFRVSKTDANKADPQFEEEIMRLQQPYWNHNGGTIAFGPDGYLYIGLGDGGAGNDPHGNGQNLTVLLGSVLRIDIDRKSGDLNYAIPADNPFVMEADVRGEIWARGLRNVWRLAFDRANGDLWVADVGQNLWEEINIVTRGGNYGWNLREGAHLFGAKGVPARKDLVDPIWEYDHEVGKSITGGYVYRGKKLPGLVGAYLYADYVSGRLWALRYDTASKKVISNHALQSDRKQVISYGEDEAGEVYFLVVDPKGQGIYRFEKTN